MRVAFVSYDFGEYSIRHATELAKHGDVLLVLPNSLAESHIECLDPAVEFYAFDRPRLRQPIRQLATNRAILKRIRKFKPDVVHFQRGHLWFNFALNRLPCPLVLTIHDPRHHLGDRGSRRTPQRVMDYGYRQADQIIVHGQQLKQTVVDEIGIPDHRVDVVPHIAIGDRLHHKPVAEEDGLILFFGRIWEYKGLDYFIRSEPIVTAKFPHARFLIAGTGEEFSRYREAMTNPDRFEIHNRWISDDERTEMFQRASVVVLPYVEATQSGVVPIAYSYSRPVVATSTGGLPDSVEHGVTGLLVPPRDENALADAIMQLLGDRDLRRKMGEKGREKLDTEFSPPAVVEQTLAVYRKAIQHSRAPRAATPARMMKASRT